MAEIAYYSDMDVDVYEDESFSLVSFLSSVKTSILNLLPALPLYYPQTERYLSEIPFPNGKKLFISDANSASTRELLESHWRDCVYSNIVCISFTNLQKH
jgi:hypothetical protein